MKKGIYEGKEVFIIEEGDQVTKISDRAHPSDRAGSTDNVFNDHLTILDK